MGAAVGVLASLMSFLDWQKNPSGIFHNELGTNWRFVFETAISWFVPVAILASIISVAVFLWRSRS